MCWYNPPLFKDIKKMPCSAGWRSWFSFVQILFDACFDSHRKRSYAGVFKFNSAKVLHAEWRENWSLSSVVSHFFFCFNEFGKKYCAMKRFSKETNYFNHTGGSRRKYPLIYISACKWGVECFISLQVTVYEKQEETPQFKRLTSNEHCIAGTNFLGWFV